MVPDGKRLAMPMDMEIYISRVTNTSKFAIRFFYILFS